MNILMLDNYDSFTYNLVQYIEEETGQSIDVRRNDGITLAEAAAYDTIVLSPGPGLPSEAGIMPALIETYAPTRRILGVCLGHQAIGEAFGASLKNLPRVYHGIKTPIDVLDGSDPLFAGLPDCIEVGRYHSWVIDGTTLPSCLRVLARDRDGEIQAIAHESYAVRGVQFHPESIMTGEGRRLLTNFLYNALTA